jgi:GNAT superfamily N-acetyltransferase
VVFPALVAAGALVTALDPVYRRLVAPRPWLNHALLGFSVFAALNVALPLVGVQPILALEVSAVMAALALAPAFRREGLSGWLRAHALALAAAALALVLVWFARGLVPPAPLVLARAVAARGVAELEPVEPVHGGVVPAATVLEWGELAAYTAVYAPAGVRQPITHIWWRDRRQIARVVLPTPVLGGRREGFRTYSRFTDLKAPVAGRYRVDVVTASGQLIGRLRFTVTP